MKRTLILPIVALALLAFVTPADAAPCEPFDREIVAARGAITLAKQALELAEKKQNNHRTLDHTLPTILGSPSNNPFCVTCMENLVAINDAKAAIRAAEKERDRAQRVHDTCMASYSCSSCNQMGVDHMLKPQPGCPTHIVYSCQSDAGTHTQVVCGGCNKTYWRCGSDASNHKQVTCSSGRMLVSNALTGWRQISVSYSGCGKTYWKCKDSSGHSIDIIRRGKVCMLPSSSSGGGTGGGGTGGGGTGGGGTGGGSGSGDSGSSVRCANMPEGATRHNRTHCDKGGYASSAYAHQATCYAHSRPITYWTCHAAARRFHSRH